MWQKDYCMGSQICLLPFHGSHIVMLHCSHSVLISNIEYYLLTSTVLISESVALIGVTLCAVTYIKSFFL